MNEQLLHDQKKKDLNEERDAMKKTAKIIEKARKIVGDDEQSNVMLDVSENNLGKKKKKKNKHI